MNNLHAADHSSNNPAYGETMTASVASPGFQGFVFALFFIFGGITSLNDVLIPKLKFLFSLTYGEAMLVQTAFFAAYLIVSLPAATVVNRLGYMRSATVGLVVMLVGCLLFVPASETTDFRAFLIALFTLASGVTLVQVVANPLISQLGHPASAHSRLTFAQAFNSLGTTIFPYVGSVLILGPLSKADPGHPSRAARATFRTVHTSAIAHAYTGIAVALAVVAAAVWLQRHRLPEVRLAPGSIFGGLDLLRRPRFAFGTLSIFLYVGAEVAVGSLIVSFLTRPDVLALGPEAAGEHVPFYWGGAMVGRFVGAYLLRVLSSGRVLAAAAAANIGLLGVAAVAHGAVGGWALLAVGLFNSIMFPTIFSLASEGLGPRTAEGSGVLCTAIVGGALVPLITGRVADLTGLRDALIIPALCYAVSLAFGVYSGHCAAVATSSGSRDSGQVR